MQLLSHIFKDFAKSHSQNRTVSRTDRQDPSQLCFYLHTQAE